jgi:cytolysin-activating lysine-acyltransferase
LESVSLKIVAPALGFSAHSEAEVIGAVTWLWMHSKRHRELPLIALSQALVPPVKAQQFILVQGPHENGSVLPVAYIAWANLSEGAERHYLAAGATAFLRPEDWSSGDRSWITDWVCPFGHTPQLRSIAQALLADSSFRFLYHRGDERGQQVKVMRGARVTQRDARAWWKERPLPGERSATIEGKCK